MEEKTAIQLVAMVERGNQITDAQLAQLLTYEPSISGTGRLSCERVGKAIFHSRLLKSAEEFKLCSKSK